MAPLTDRRFGHGYQTQALAAIGGVGLVSGVAATAAAFWLLGPEAQSLGLLVGAALALVTSCAAVYVLSSFHTDRQLDAHELQHAHRYARFEDRLARLERAAPDRDDARHPDLPSGTLLNDPRPAEAEIDEPPDTPSNSPDLQDDDGQPAARPDEPIRGGLDPWLHGFSGCLEGREVLDREPVPPRRSSTTAREDGEDDD